MRKTKLGNIFAIIALLGVLLLFVALILGGKGANLAIITALITLSSVGVAAIWNHLLKGSSVKKIFSNILASISVCAVLFGTAIWGMTAYADTDLTSAVGVNGLTINSVASGTVAWTAENGKVLWSGTTGSTTEGCNTTYTANNGELVITNNSGETTVLSFNYQVSLNNGTVFIDGKAVTANGSFAKRLTNGASVTIKTSTSPDSDGTTTATLSSIAIGKQSVSMTFEPAENGTITVDGSAINASTSIPKTSADTYSLIATPAEHYIFVGWYLDNTLYSTAKSLPSENFFANGVITAKFAYDPIYQQATVSGGSAYTKDDLVDINSQYYHDATNKVVYNGSIPANNSAYSQTGCSRIKDKLDVYYIPSLQWGDSAKVSYSGTAKGDYMAGATEQTHASARMLSDVICVYAKENCNISFDYSNSITGGESEKTQNIVYYYVTSATSVSVSTIKANGLQLTEKSGTSGTIALSKGMYLYIVAEGYTSKAAIASVASMNFSYSASISNFVIAYNENKDVLSAGFRDNTGTVIPSGKLTINSVAYSIGSNGNITDMEFANLAQVALKVSTVPSGYTHIGWAITANGETTYQYTAEYSRTMTEDCTIIAVFVPHMTITMGANGYSDATYKLSSGAAANGQYVARNADFTKLYTSLADAFAETDTVVLLATATINGNWEIPSGKTLVIPFGLTDQGSTTPVSISTTSSSVSNYCKVTLNGTLTVNGTLLVNAQQYCSTGSSRGPIGHLSMADGSSMTVNGVLYSYGPITGSGTITANGSAKVHEFIEVKDPRSVVYVYNIYSGRNEHHTFPFNGMFINNIEVPVTYELGATLTGHLSLKYESISTAEIPLIGKSGAMFNFTSGSMTKYFDKATGQFVIQINEGTEAYTGSFAMSLTVTIATQTQTVNINSSDYYLALSAAYKFDVAGNFTINDNYKFLPGATLNIREGGEVIIAADSNVVFYRMNDYDYRGLHSGSSEQWGYGHSAYPMNPIRFPGVTYPFSFTAANVGSAKLNVDGTLTVKGGLYVTESLKTEGDGITYKDNGYNFLTGTGTIDMSAAKTDLPSISEAMAASGTNDIAWDTVAVVPMKGMYVGETEDLPENYSSLAGDIFYGYNNGTYSVWFTNEVALKDKDEGGNDVDLFYIRTVGAGNALSVGVVMDANGTIVAIVDPEKGTCYTFSGWSADGTAANAVTTANLLTSLFSSYSDRAVLYAAFNESHSYTIESCDREYCWNECVCGLQDAKVKRVYTLIFTDYFGKITEKDVNYGDVSILTISTSNIFELSHAGWKINGAGNALASDALWNAFTIDANTTTLNVTEATTPTAIKPGAITMTVNYNNLPAGIAMQVIFFVPVETVDSTAPEVLLNGADTGVANVHVGEAEGNPIAMYQVTVDLTAAQVAEKATGDSGNAAITIEYTDVNLTKQLDSVLLAYAKALQSQLSGSAMGSQANAMEAVMNYGAAVQIYFNAGNEFDFAFTGYTADEIEKYASNIDLSGNAMSNTENGITFTWKSANVNFRTEYNLRYYFTLTGLPEGVTPTTATLTVTYSDGKTPAAVYENLAVEADGSRYRVTYPVPASDLAKEGTSVKLVVTLSDGTTVSSSDFSYGINAYLKRSIYQYTEGQKKVANDTDGTKTTQYVNMLVSLIKLGEAVSEIESTTATE